MAYSIERAIREEALTITLSDERDGLQLSVGGRCGITGLPKGNGSWTVLKIEGRTVFLERKIEKIRAHWVRWLTVVEYK
jgi:hypothetical protein